MMAYDSQGRSLAFSFGSSLLPASAAGALMTFSKIDVSTGSPKNTDILTDQYIRGRIDDHKQ